jgi:hypothetical protein
MPKKKKKDYEKWQVLTQWGSNLIFLKFMAFDSNQDPEEQYYYIRITMSCICNK